MNAIPTWPEFWAYAQTPLGLGVMVVAMVGFLKRLDNANLPRWLKMIGEFVTQNAMLVSVLTAVLLSLIIFIINEYNLSDTVGKYFIIFALAWAASQGGYAVQKATTMYVRRIRGDTNASEPG